MQVLQNCLLFFLQPFLRWLFLSLHCLCRLTSQNSLVYFFPFVAQFWRIMIHIWSAWYRNISSPLGEGIILCGSCANVIFEVVRQRLLIFTFITKIPFRKPTFCSAITELMVPAVVEASNSKNNWFISIYHICLLLFWTCIPAFLCNPQILKYSITCPLRQQAIMDYRVFMMVAEK